MKEGDRVVATRNITSGLFSHIDEGTQGTIKKVKHDLMGESYEVEFDGGHHTQVKDSSIKPA